MFIIVQFGVDWLNGCGTLAQWVEVKIEILPNC